MTVDEELNALDEAVRRLKVEYDVFFGGGSKRPPAETEWRVHSIVKRLSDSQRLSFSQRFRYNSIVQRYSIFNALWQQKLKVKEEGYRRPQDALLAIQGLRWEQEQTAQKDLEEGSARPLSDVFAVQCSSAPGEPDKVRQLFNAMIEAKKRVGESAPNANFDSFLAFVTLKTEQVRRDYKCKSVEYRVEVEGNKVRLKARAVESQ